MKFRLTLHPARHALPVVVNASRLGATLVLHPPRVAAVLRTPFAVAASTGAPLEDNDGSPLQDNDGSPLRDN